MRNEINRVEGREGGREGDLLQENTRLDSPVLGTAREGQVLVDAG